MDYQLGSCEQNGLSILWEDNYGLRKRIEKDSKEYPFWCGVVETQEHK